jgi:hypothetical protein
MQSDVVVGLPDESIAERLDREEPGWRISGKYVRRRLPPSHTRIRVFGRLVFHALTRAACLAPLPGCGPTLPRQARRDGALCVIRELVRAWIRP